MILVSLSGGLDSAVVAAKAKAEQGEGVAAYAFRYGQRHGIRELDAAEEVTEFLGIPFTVIDIPPAVLHSPALVNGDDVPEGHYLDPAMAATVVHGRNLLFVSLLVALAQPGDTVALGIQGGERSFYPDCRPSFLQPLAAAIDAAYDVTLSTPVGDMAKWDVVALGQRVGAPMHLTWSCFGSGDAHCGRCSPCVKRAEAFHVAGVPDPTVYADPNYWRTAVEGQ